MMKSDVNFKKMPFSKQLVLVLGIFCVLWGLFFLYLAFDKESLSKDSKIDEVTEYIADKPKLSIGEVKVTKSTEYIKGGEYKLVYKNYMKEDQKEALDPTSGIGIVDVLGNGYKLVKDSVIVNDKDYSDNSEIKVITENQMIKIDIPHELCPAVNTIEVKIKLQETTPGVKYFTSQDAYYNFTPSDTNKFYEKKTPQSYLIDGNGFIKLSGENK